MKKTIAFAMIVAMLLGMASFGSAEETTKITFASYQWNEAGYGDFYRYAAEKFHERYPQYEIEEVSIPAAQYWEKIDCWLMRAIVRRISCYTKQSAVPP